MPPIKGRMMGRMSRAGNQPAVSGFQRVKNLGLGRKKARMHLPTAKATANQPADLKDERLLKLRIPDSICQALPSVKRFKGSKGFVDLTEDGASNQSEESDMVWEEKPMSQHVLGIKRAPKGNIKSKYFVRPLCEEKFSGMIWDVAFSPKGDVLVSCGDGILICNMDLEVKNKLDNIILAGGVAFLSDSKIVAVCRNTDTVNVFTPDGVFIDSFKAGKSPMAIAVNSRDELIVCDPGEKCVRVYDIHGETLQTISTVGKGYQLRWPLYVHANSDNTFIVSDCHSQKVLKFDARCRFVRSIALGTSGGNELLRPHGLCVHQNTDVFIIDNATDTLEVFDAHDTFIQTLIPPEEGHPLRPKAVRVSENGQLALGGLCGTVKLYQFISEEDLDIKPKKEAKTPTKRTPRSSRAKVEPKVEVKTEVFEIKEEIILDDEEESTSKAEETELPEETSTKEEVEKEEMEEQADSGTDGHSVIDAVIVEDSDEEEEAAAAAEKEEEAEVNTQEEQMEEEEVEHVEDDEDVIEEDEEVIEEEEEVIEEDEEVIEEEEEVIEEEEEVEEIDEDNEADSSGLALSVVMEHVSENHIAGLELSDPIDPVTQDTPQDVIVLDD